MNDRYNNLIDVEPVSGQRLAVIIPALNEARTIGDVIDRIPREIDGIDSIRVIVIDDGSRDATAEIATQHGATVVQHPRNLGVGAAFAAGLEYALRSGADVIVNMDGDGQFRPEDIPDLIAPILTRRYGFVTCTRFADVEKLPEMPQIKLWGNRMMCRLVNAIIGGDGFTDVSCGFRAYSRDTALRMNLFGSFTYTQETFIDLAAKRISMTEVPLVVRGEREHGKSRVASNLWHYAFRTSSIILRALRDWRPLLFFGSIAVTFSGLGVAMLAFVGWWWITFHQTSPWTSLITVGGVFAVMGVAFAVLALIADQIGRSRKIQEQLLYMQRQQAYARSGSELDRATPLRENLIEPAFQATTI
ncbi:Undecaprenyl-phosphate mannosyltransferase [Rosistilla ulvae]|uniref:Undecaprenyl-phosphate mannosyltransferase n=1 Tax=Rosistilla ulvae TaxID=1930277 RepID=A0A517M841_9BACT|nr:glycosyltransferase family 2 protein [Rosistilla ulvae]QDS91034.1 Undecaprenyl-phosphate mannosyltransferase [Rosistilla ulvae]